MAENFETFQTGFKNIAHHAEQFDKSVGHSELTVRRLIVSLAGAHIGEQLLKVGVAQSAVVTSLKNGFLALEKGTVEIAKTQFNLENQIKSNLRETTALKGTASRQYLNSLKQESLYLQTQLNVSNAQLAVKQSLSRFGLLDFAMMGVTINGVRDLYHTHKLVNEALIEANGDLQMRIGLTKAVLRTQQQLGSEIGTTRDAARALVAYGYDLDTSFQSNLKLVVQLHDGLGMAVAESAELVAVYDRQLKAPVRDVADAITRIVDQTALAADQAGRMATNIGRAMAMLRPGLSKDFGAVNELVGRYEGALVKLGGEFGGFQKMLTRMTTREGITQAGMLGTTNPEFIASERATKHVLDSFVAYSKQLLGGSGGLERAMKLDVLAEQFGTTAEQINLMIKAGDEANNVRTTSLTLEERYRQQVLDSGKVFQRLYSSLNSLVQQAAIPLLQVLTPMAGYIADFAKSLVESKYAVGVVAGALTLTLPFVIAKTISATAAFISLSLAIAASARAATLRTATDYTQMMLPGFGPGGGGSVGKTVASTLPKITKYLGAIASAFAVGWTIGEIYNAIQRQARHIDEKFVSHLKFSYEDVVRRTLEGYARSGNVTGINTTMAKAGEHYKGLGMASQRIAAQMAILSEGLSDETGTARFRKEWAQSSIQPDPRLTGEAAILEARQSEILDISTEHRNIALKQLEELKKQGKNFGDAQQEATINRRLKGPDSTPSEQFWNQVYGHFHDNYGL